MSAERIRPGIDTNTAYGDSVITHIADGGGWKTTITVINLSSFKAAAYTLNFYGDDGNAKQFSFVGIGNSGMVTGTLAPAAEAIIRTAGTATPSTQGWAIFDSATSNDISGFAVFSYVNGQEAVVPFESSIDDQQLLSFDNTGGQGMGVALANSSSYQVVQVLATCYDDRGVIIGTDTFAMQPLTHAAYIFKDHWPFTANRRGTMRFKAANWGLAVLGLRFTPAGAFTSVHALKTND
jgi:hypothetical protein